MIDAVSPNGEIPQARELLPDHGVSLHFTSTASASLLVTCIAVAVVSSVAATRQTWPFSLLEYWRLTERADIADYELVKAQDPD